MYVDKKYSYLKWSGKRYSLRSQLYLTPGKQLQKFFLSSIPRVITSAFRNLCSAGCLGPLKAQENDGLALFEWLRPCSEHGGIQLSFARPLLLLQCLDVSQAPPPDHHRWTYFHKLDDWRKTALMDFGQAQLRPFVTAQLVAVNARSCSATTAWCLSWCLNGWECSLDSLGLLVFSDRWEEEEKSVRERETSGKQINSF